MPWIKKSTYEGAGNPVEVNPIPSGHAEQPVRDAQMEHAKETAGPIGAAALWYWRWFKGGGFWTRVAAILAPLLVLSAVIGAIGGGADAPESEATTGTTPRSSLSLAVSVTPEPTATVDSAVNRLDCSAIQGTDYRSPDERVWYLANCLDSGTATPAVVNAATGRNASLSVEEYTSQLSLLALLYSDGLGTMGDLTINADLTRQSWYEDVGFTAGLLLGYGEAFRELRPPACLEGAHRTILSGVADIDRSLSLMIDGLASLDIDDLELAVEYMTRGGTTIRQATSLIEQAQC